MGADLDRIRAVAATDGYKAGDPDAVAAYYRIHFKAALARPEDYERLMAIMRPSFTTSEAILKARHVEDRLMADAWSLDGYDLLPSSAAWRGHFAYPECAEPARKEIEGLFRDPPARPK